MECFISHIFVSEEFYLTMFAAWYGLPGARKAWKTWRGTTAVVLIIGLVCRMREETERAGFVQLKNRLRWNLIAVCKYITILEMADSSWKGTENRLLCQVKIWFNFRRALFTLSEVAQRVCETFTLEYIQHLTEQIPWQPDVPLKFVLSNGFSARGSFQTKVF